MLALQTGLEKFHELLEMQQSHVVWFLASTMQLQELTLNVKLFWETAWVLVVTWLP